MLLPQRRSRLGHSSTLPTGNARTAGVPRDAARRRGSVSGIAAIQSMTLANRKANRRLMISMRANICEGRLWLKRHYLFSYAW